MTIKEARYLSSAELNCAVHQQVVRLYCFSFSKEKINRIIKQIKQKIIIFLSNSHQRTETTTLIPPLPLYHHHHRQTNKQTQTIQILTSRKSF